MEIDPNFFNRKSHLVARDLLGLFLVRETGGGEESCMLTEVEAYAGPEDLASHARFGKTPRTTPMFGPPGTIYIYFTYGMHFMLNIACQPEGNPSAVLIRGAGQIVGPARLTKALEIDKKLNGQMIGKASGLWFEDCGVIIKPGHIEKTPRVGISYAGEWAAKPWRFRLIQK